MYQRIVFYVLLVTGLTVNAQTTINLSGKISNHAGQAIANATVTLVRQNLKDTTGSDGTYSITRNTAVRLPAIVPNVEKISLMSGILELKLSNPSPVKVAIFDVKGNLQKKIALPNAAAGVYQWNIAKNFQATNLLVIKACVGKRVMLFRYLPLKSGNYAVNPYEDCTSPASGRLLKMAAPVDSLRTTASGYKTKVVTISSYDTVVDIALDTVGSGSEGCGKTPPASGVAATINVNGTTRDYILVLPDNYDPNKPYKLIFVPHPLGGSMEGTIRNGFHGLLRESNNEAIFVAPDGIDDGFANTGGRDIAFFEALLDRFNSTCCIDQERVFSTGFSFGGMMSFAVGCALWEKFRAIAPCSGAFYSGCDRSNQGPIAVWQAHGISDNIVPLRDGETARDYFLQRNGCSNRTVPVDPSPCVEYQDCEDGYPYIYCAFEGGHAPASWQAAAIWKFFSQF
ncbi:MAG: hypothetical protein JW768_16520 [Chitinispirillaceae bacterium]|nr:hypothetical protein [Chitinispirillaceae bacterium]